MKLVMTLQRFLAVLTALVIASSAYAADISVGNLGIQTSDSDYLKSQIEICNQIKNMRSCYEAAQILEGESPSNRVALRRILDLYERGCFKGNKDSCPKRKRIQNQLATLSDESKQSDSKSGKHTNASHNGAISWELTHACNVSGNRSLNGSAPSIRLKFFEVENSKNIVHTFPSGKNESYVLAAHSLFTNTEVKYIPCTSGNLVCYSAYFLKYKDRWGLKSDASGGCQTCCQTCSVGTKTKSVRFSC